MDNQRLWWPSWISNHYEIYRQLFRTPSRTFLASRVTLYVVVWKAIGTYLGQSEASADIGLQITLKSKNTSSGSLEEHLW